MKQLIIELKRIGVIRSDNSYNTRAGMSLFKSGKYYDIKKQVLDVTSFLIDVPNSQRIHAIVNSITSLVLCPTCKTTQPKFVSFVQGYKTFCSPKCAQTNPETREKIEQTNQERYGSIYPCGNKEIENKRKHTCKEKYGSDTPFQSEDVQQKVRETILEKYGVVSTALVPEIAERQKQARLKKFGVEFPFQSIYVQDKVNQTHQQEFGTNRFSKSLVNSDARNKLEDREWLKNTHITGQKPLTQISSLLGVSDVTVGNYLHKYGLDTKHFSHSSGEKEVLSFMQELLPNTTILENSQRIISPYELDIYIPTYNLAIEYCGLYWHSDKFKENNYHRNKLHKCREKNIRLLTIFEDEWNDKQDIVKSKIESILQKDKRQVIYARKTHIVNVTTKTKKDFLDQHHIQGTGPGSVTYGLINNNTLVAVMTFIQRGKKYELNRYATSCRVIGGFGKLLKHFQNNHIWNEIVSFADLRWSEGNLYECTGWELDKILRPDYYWVRNDKRFHKFNFRHKHLKNILVNYDSSLSENENCKNNNMVKIYNCGLNRYVLRNQNEH